MWYLRLRLRLDECTHVVWQSKNKANEIEIQKLAFTITIFEGGITHFSSSMNIVTKDKSVMLLKTEPSTDILLRLVQQIFKDVFLRI